MDAAPPPNISLSTPEQSYNSNISSPQGQAQTNYPEIQAFLFNFKIQNNVEKRRQESNKIRSKFPDKIAIIYEKDPQSNLSNIENNKFLVSKDLTVFKFIEEIKKNIIFLVLMKYFC